MRDWCHCSTPRIDSTLPGLCGQCDGQLSDPSTAIEGEGREHTYSMPSNTQDIEINDVVQIDPAHNPVFGGNFLVVTEVKTWGVQGYCKPLDDKGGLAYYRVPFDKIRLVGHAEWVRGESDA